jgi:hypothetical protein
MSAPFFLVLGAAADSGRGWIGGWSPGIGDPDFVGWATVVGYLTASYLCWRRFRSLGASGHDAVPRAMGSLVTLFLAFAGARRRLLALPTGQRLRTLWLGLAVVLLLLGINKQLDLQTALTEGARIWSKSAGWYTKRWPVQVGFIGFVALVGLAAFRAVLLLASGELRSLRLALGGTLFIICFVTIRAASFHHVDRLLGSDILGFRMNWIIEVGGILLIIFGALGSSPTRAGRAERGGLETFDRRL